VAVIRKNPDLLDDCGQGDLNRLPFYQSLDSRQRFPKATEVAESELNIF